MYTETEFEKLIKTVETEFSAHLAQVEKDFNLSKSENGTGSLAKAEDGKKPEPKKDGKEEKKPEEKAPGAKEASPAPAEDGQEPGAQPPAAEGEQAAAAPAAEGAPADPAAGGAVAPQGPYDAEDLEHLEKMYMSMSDEELKLHHDAIAKCGAAKGNMAKCGDMQAAPPPKHAEGAQPQAAVQKSELNAHPENAPMPTDNAKAMNGDAANGGIEGQAPSNSPGAKSPASDANGKKGIYKSEHDRRNGGKIEGQAPSGSPGAKSPASKEQGNLSNMEKSEQTKELELAKAEAAEAKAKAETLQKNLDGVSQFITKLLEKRGAPQGKAITSLDVIAKSETTPESKELPKVEIDAQLGKKAQDPKLEKSDRDAINDYYLGSRNIDKIRHLLK